MDLHGAMRAFTRLAEVRNFSSVARELNVAQSTVG
jgi:DNA-binding transcriptional LysR family regulator